MANMPVTVITNATNRGFPAAVNQGLKAARGEYLVLLNNDVIVTDGWLEQLIGLVNARKGGEAEGPGAAGNATADGSGRPSVGPVRGRETRAQRPASPTVLRRPAPFLLSALCPVLRGPPPRPPLHKVGKGNGASNC